MRCAVRKILNFFTDRVADHAEKFRKSFSCCALLTCLLLFAGIAAAGWSENTRQSMARHEVPIHQLSDHGHDGILGNADSQQIPDSDTTARFHVAQTLQRLLLKPKDFSPAPLEHTWTLVGMMSILAALLLFLLLLLRKFRPDSVIFCFQTVLTHALPVRAGPALA